MNPITTNLNRVLEPLGGQPLDLVQLELNHLCNELEETMTDEDLLIKDLAMLVKRLCRRLERDMRRGTVDPANRVIVEQAYGFLGRKNLQGSPLRSIRHDG